MDKKLPKKSSPVYLAIFGIYKLNYKKSQICFMHSANN